MENSTSDDSRQKSEPGSDARTISLPSVARISSIAVLAVTVVLAAVLFFRVIWPFVFPIFFAAALAVLFRPVHLWWTRVFRGRQRIAAALTTVGVVLTVMLPLSGALILAGVELVDAGREVLQSAGGGDGSGAAGAAQQTLLHTMRESLSAYLSDEQVERLSQAASAAFDNLVQAVSERTRSLVADVAFFVVRLVVMILALYYLFADSDKVAREAEHLIPLDVDDQQLLFERFESVCRSVVLGTLVAGIVQGLFAGIGFAVVGCSRVWLLSVLTIFFSFIPFLGAAMIWLAVVASLVLQQEYVSAVLLTAYGTVVISGSDNLIKAVVIGNRTRMHPFLILVTVLGALQFVGLWGIFLGPVTAAFFFALATSLRRKLAESQTA